MHEAVEIVLPWPDKRLSPNARIHRMQRAKLVKEARSAAYYLALEARAKRLSGSDRLALDLTFCPPDKRRRDWDNVIASLKGAFDGIADACGVDDSRWQVSFRWGDPCKGGAVVCVVKSVQEALEAIGIRNPPAGGAPEG